MVKRALPLMLLLLPLGAGCNTGFEDQSIVIDLRVLAMRTDPAEVVVDVDPNDLASVVLPPVTVTALIADPQGPRPISFSMTACGAATSLRCDDPDVTYKLPMTDGMMIQGTEATAVLQANVALLQAALAEDDFKGLGGIPVNVEMVVRAPDGYEVHAAKRIMYAARVPAARTANSNPTIGGLLARGEPFTEDAPLVVAQDEKVVLLPVEEMGVREVYVTPTLDGGERTFTENLRYSWLATRGHFSDETTGGATDLFGNKPVLDTKWTAPKEAGEVSLWVVQRDERGGTSWTHRTIVVQ